MECKICFDTGAEPLLEHVCACKGSQGAIHQTCLKQWLIHKMTKECDVCKQMIQLPVQRILIPKGASWLFSNAFDVGFRIGIYCLYKFHLTTLLNSIHWLLLPLYLWSYHPLLRELGSVRYVVKWLYPIYYHKGVLLYPLPNLLMIYVTIHIPYLLLFINPYKEIWFLHKALFWDAFL